MAIVLDNKAHKQQRTMMTEDKSRTRLSKSIYLVFGLAAALAVSFFYDATIFTVDLTNSILYQSEPDFAAPTVIHSNSIVLSTTNNQDTYNITTQSSPPIKLRQSTLPDTTNNNTSTIEEVKFVRYDNVAIATKIHGPHQWPLVVQSMCLLHFAYNNKVLYDIIVFTAEPIPVEDVESLQKMLAPAKVSIVIDNIGLQEEIAALTPARHEKFMERCNVSSPENLTWFSNCRGELDGNGSPTRLAYAWQAEFRSVRVWHHPALADYKYMVWLDSDGFCSKPWEKDPVEYFIKNDGIIMFDHFPQGAAPPRVQSLIKEGFNASVCDLKLNKKSGNLERTLIDKDTSTSCKIPNIHGFFHITNLDFYRSPPVKHGLETLLGDCFLCRSPDDQLAVTIPAAIFAPERSWEMRSKGFKLDVFHNFHLDGHEKAGPPGFVKYWGAVAKYDMPSADGICSITQRD
ncbi:MAG: hypothetical protein ACI90V_002925 [Bacillariaceae sp.]|jgi:hypothetical protein